MCRVVFTTRLRPELDNVPPSLFDRAPVVSTLSMSPLLCNGVGPNARVVAGEEPGRNRSVVNVDKPLRRPSFTLQGSPQLVSEATLLRCSRSALGRDRELSEARLSSGCSFDGAVVAVPDAKRKLDSAENRHPRSVAEHFREEFASEHVGEPLRIFSRGASLLFHKVKERSTQAVPQRRPTTLFGVKSSWQWHAVARRPPQPRPLVVEPSWPQSARESPSQHIAQT